MTKIKISSRKMMGMKKPKNKMVMGMIKMTRMEFKNKSSLCRSRVIRSYR